ncbi:malonyl-ACP O-methyltransferase BioC [Thioalkalicoccus limnaeus]|uniref:Malonyl-[acyl-carrier protein] O-methyltransferase n=1 Tax=Thioalkalicoccus limnaeus TaxID=120681 RepID=A0ABV4BHU8_9GAMM
MSLALIDKAAARRAFTRAAPAYDGVALLQQEIEQRLLARLDYIRLDPRLVLDLGAGTGHAVDGLQRRFRRAPVLALDFAESMLHQARRRGRWGRRPLCLCADAERLPLADGCVDLIFSNAMFQWCNDLERTFGECLRVLRPGGALLFSTFGPDTLKELRAAWAAVDGETHVSGFLDMHDIGDALVRARFADPVMDVDRLTVTYDRVRDLMRDLKQLGAHNAAVDRPRGLTGRRRLAAVEAAYERERREGRLPATYEVVYGLAWVGQQKPVDGGVAIPLEGLRFGRGGRR